MTRMITAVALALLASASAQSQQRGSDAPSGPLNVDEQIEQALGAAPPQVRQTASVRDFTGKTLREGTGTYTCFPAPEGLAGPMCMDAPFLAWMDASMSGKPATTSQIGISYMLAGDSLTGGASNIDPAALKPEPGNSWVVEGPHVMIIVPDDALLAGLPTTPVKDGPYVMWPGTPYAHIMIPVAERLPQRPASAR